VDEWEIEVGRLVLQEVIGWGTFGAVWKTLLSEPDGKPGNRTVAAKCFTRKIMYGCTIGIAPNSIPFCVAVRESMTV